MNALCLFFAENDGYEKEKRREMKMQHPYHTYIHIYIVLTTLMLFKSIIKFLADDYGSLCMCRWAKVSGLRINCLSEVSLAVSGILSSKKQK